MKPHEGVVSAWRRAAGAFGTDPVECDDPAEGFRASLLAICAKVLGSAPLGRPSPEALAAAVGRLAAGIADRGGLRRILSDMDGLPPDPVHAWRAADRREDPSARDLAVYGWHEVSREPVRATLDAALDASAESSGVEAHPLRLGAGPSGKDCLGCAWNQRGTCLQVGPPWGGPSRIPKGCPACARWEPILVDEDCAACGACCREGYGMAPVRKGEAMLDAHPEWVVGKGASAHLPRPGGRCVALAGDGTASNPWRCRDYPVRPRACSQLRVGGRGCLDARRRTGLSAG